MKKSVMMRRSYKGHCIHVDKCEERLYWWRVYYKGSMINDGLVVTSKDDAADAAKKYINERKKLEKIFKD